MVADFTRVHPCRSALAFVVKSRCGPCVHLALPLPYLWIAILLLAIAWTAHLFYTFWNCPGVMCGIYRAAKNLTPRL